MFIGQVNTHRTRAINWLALMIVFVSYSSIDSFSQEQRQSPPNTQEDEPEIACPVSTEMVLIEIEVREKTGTLVPFLTHYDFVIYEDGIKQSIAYIREENEVGTGKVKYKVGYYPTNMLRDGKYREIAVAVVEGQSLELKVQHKPRRYRAPID